MASLIDLYVKSDPNDNNRETCSHRINEGVESESKTGFMLDSQA